MRPLLNLIQKRPSLQRYPETVGMPWARYYWRGPHLQASAMQLRLFIQLLRFLANRLRTALVYVGMPETRHTSLSDSQLRSRFGDVELPAWHPARTYAISSIGSARTCPCMSRRRWTCHGCGRYQPSDSEA